MALHSTRSQTSDGWGLAVELHTRWLDGAARADWLLERHAERRAAIDRSRCQELFLGAIRHHLRIRAVLDPLVKRAPRSRLRAILHIACAEIIDNTTAPPAVIVDHAVNLARDLCSKAESGLVNAVLRKVAGTLRQPAPDPDSATEASLSLHFSHPPWLVGRWIAHFGRPATLRLLEWNQTPATVHVRLPAGVPAPACLEPTGWEGFHRLKPGRWSELGPLIDSGAAYVQDPATRLAPALLAPRPGATVLDLCAAPGGKSLQLAAASGPGGLVVCVDQPGPRMLRLRQNSGRFGQANPPGARIELVEADVLRLDAAGLAALGLPVEYEAVLLDAPCSNTGVLRRRPDVRWRLDPGEPAAQAVLQLQLLHAAAALVAPGGRLVYSTCSIEPEENSGVVAAFMGEHGADFEPGDRVESHPWETGHDGAAAFLFHRRPR